MKRLREKISPRRVRFFHCGEYGDQFGRPHYHALLFGFDFADKYVHRKRRGVDYYRSATLESLWTKGNSEIGDVTFESAAYVARYIVKKQTGKGSEIYYQNIDEETGEILVDLKKEYVTMSRRPGIGKYWYEKYKTDVYPRNEVILGRGDKLIRMKPPQAYRRYLESEDSMEHLRLTAVAKAEKRDPHEQSHERLMVKEELQLLRLDKLKRGYENGT